MAADETSKYRRIAGKLRNRIRSGEYAPGSLLPSKAALMEKNHVSLGTVNGALKVLRDEGLIETRQGSGTFVADPLPEQARSEYEAMTHRLDEIAGEVRQLREEVAELKRAKEA
jgi:DNA-binding GntR family transcriptional regulator